MYEEIYGVKPTGNISTSEFGSWYIACSATAVINVVMGLIISPMVALYVVISIAVVTIANLIFLRMAMPKCLLITFIMIFVIADTIVTYCIFAFAREVDDSGNILFTWIFPGILALICLSCVVMMTAACFLSIRRIKDQLSHYHSLSNNVRDEFWKNVKIGNMEDSDINILTKYDIHICKLEYVRDANMFRRYYYNSPIVRGGSVKCLNPFCDETLAQYKGRISQSGLRKSSVRITLESGVRFYGDFKYLDPMTIFYTDYFIDKLPRVYSCRYCEKDYLDQNLITCEECLYKYHICDRSSAEHEKRHLSLAQSLVQN